MATDVQSSSAKLKRFYKEVGLGEEAEGYTVLLDSRPLHTPGRQPLVLARQLAEALASEWAEQQEFVVPENMPLTATTFTALDLVPARRDAVVDELTAYTETELLCHRAETPHELVERQARFWDPLLEWTAFTYDAPLACTCGILPVEQPDKSRLALRHVVETFDDLCLAALASAVHTAGSLIIGLALAKGRITAEAAFDAAELDATYQMELWGEDPEATARRQRIRQELQAAARVFTASTG